MNNYLSTKIKTISFILMVMVVFLHSYNVIVRMNIGNLILNNGYSSFIQYFISYGITRIAVPLFFSISGYLFFLNFKASLNDFLLKLKKRFHSVLIPYIFWSMWGLLFFYLLQLIPLTKSFFTNERIINYSFFKILDTIFLHPIPYQLWFLRDLFLLFLISPLIYWAVKYISYFFILVLFVAWFIDFNLSSYFSIESILFYSFGAFLSFKNKFNFNYLINSIAFIALLWFVLVFIHTYLTYIDFHPYLIKVFLFKSSILIGLITIWYGYDSIFKNKNITNTRIFSIFQFSFFLYVFHEPVLTIFKKALFYLLGRGQLISLFIYILAPVLTIVVSISIAIYIKKYFPKIYYFITGGR